MSEMHWALWRGDSKSFDILSDEGYEYGNRCLEPDGFDEWLELTFSAASPDGKVILIDEVLDRSLDLDGLGKAFANGAYWASVNGRLDILEKLLSRDCGIGLDEEFPIYRVASYRDKVHADCLSLLIQALPFGERALESLKLALESAIQSGSCRSQELLLRALSVHGACIQQIADDPVRRAFLWSDRDLANELIGKTGDVDALNAWLEVALQFDELEAAQTAFSRLQGGQGKHELLLNCAVIASMADAEKCAKWLLDFGRHSNSGEWLRRPLEVAIESRSLSVLRMILDSGAHLTERASDGRWTSLAPSAPNFSTAKVLIGHGVDLNLLDGTGYSLLHRAGESGDLEWVSWLHSNGADLNITSPLWGTPLHLAVRTERWKVIQFLLDCGADPNIENIDGARPLDWARSCFVQRYLQSRGARFGEIS